MKIITYLTIQGTYSPKKPVSPDNLALFSANGETSQSEAIECRLATPCKACGAKILKCDRHQLQRICEKLIEIETRLVAGGGEDNA